MILLLAANLSPRIVGDLVGAGFEATHVGDHDLLAASDHEIFDWAAAHQAVVVTADSDFGALLASSRGSSPSVVLLRGVAELGAAAHARLLIDNLDRVEDDLVFGAIVSLSPDRLRVRRLPIET